MDSCLKHAGMTTLRGYRTKEIKGNKDNNFIIVRIRISIYEWIL
jgi:hypothetical protein